MTNDPTRSGETTTKTAWGVELTWPDGHSEVLSYPDRDGAEARVTMTTREKTRGQTEATPVLVSETVTVSRSGWAPVGKP